jgi:hypothetical protein
VLLIFLIFVPQSLACKVTTLQAKDCGTFFNQKTDETLLPQNNFATVHLFTFNFSKS